MAYFASLLPNTALAKDGGRSVGDQGLAYLDASLLQTHFWLACTISVLSVALVAWRSAKVDRRRLFVLGAPLLAAVIHLLYVVRIGGDDIADRFTVAPLFALCLPAAVLAIPLGGGRPAASDARWWLSIAATVVVAGWAVTSLATNPLIPSTQAPYVTDYLSLRKNPVDLPDLMDTSGRRQEIEQAVADGLDVALIYPFAGGPATPLPLPPGSGVHVGLCCVGSEAARLPLEVRIIDESSLGDPIGARLVRDPTTDLGTNGKLLPTTWALAQLPPPTLAEGADVAAARRALQCGDLALLQSATRDDLTPGRLLGNILAAPRLATTQVPASPVDAVELFCDS